MSQENQAAQITQLRNQLETVKSVLASQNNQVTQLAGALDTLKNEVSQLKAAIAKQSK
ncbi:MULTISPECIES: hypothetical protein [Klebsiella]|uniref:hypothetical protein n=1 Tax=Klebsiella TaxID=570 RepID=UPI0015A8F1F8|nr:hypothetical protein [Klebsiella grimontii]HEC2049761.1 hypothetical protein [Klebsiella oxytoca]